MAGVSGNSYSSLFGGVVILSVAACSLLRDYVYFMFNAQAPNHLPQHHLVSLFFKEFAYVGFE